MFQIFFIFKLQLFIAILPIKSDNFKSERSREAFFALAKASYSLFLRIFSLSARTSGGSSLLIIISSPSTSIK